MKLTLDSLRDAVGNELRRTPSRSTIEELVNEAGEAWVNSHSWVYLRDRSQVLELQAEVELYRLGLGVRSVRSIDRVNNPYGPIPIVDFDFLERERNTFQAEARRVRDPIAALQWSQQADDDRPRLYLHVFPAEETESATLIYEAGWLPLDKSDDVADVPPSLGVHFRDWVRFYAMMREFPDKYPPGALDAFRQQHSYQTALKVDGKIHRRIIPAEGGAGERYRRIQQRKQGMWTPNEMLRQFGALREYGP